MTDEQRSHRGQAAQRALDEFLSPAFAKVIEIYSARLEEIAATAPWEAGKITALANAVRIAKQVQNNIGEIVENGKVAAQTIERKRKMERLSPRERNILGI